MTIDIISLQASTITELRKRVAVAEQEAKSLEARHQGVASLLDSLQASYAELQHDYRRLTQAHQSILLAYGALLREHRAATTGLGAVIERERTPLTTNSGDCGIEFTDEMECNRQHCPTSPPHRHITPPATPKSPGVGVPPCPDRNSNIQGSRTASTISDSPDNAFPIPKDIRNQGSRLQAELDDDFGDPDVNPTRKNPRQEAQRRTADSVNEIFQNGREVPPGALPASMEPPASIRTSTNNNMRPHGTPPLDINQGPPASNTSEKGGAQGNPNLKPITVDQAVDLIQAGHGDRVYLHKAPIDTNEAPQQLQDSARIASKFADASGEAGPHVVDWHEERLNEAAETGIAEALDKIHAELRQEIDIVSDCGFQARDGSDETRNTPDKSTEDR